MVAATHTESEVGPDEVSAPLVVAVLSRHAVVRAGLRRALAAAGGLEVVEASDASGLAGATVVVVDRRELAALEPVDPAERRVLVIGDDDRVDDGGAVEVDRRRGVAGVLDVIRDPARRPRRRWSPPGFAPLPLSERERAMLRLLAAGSTSQEIASHLGTSARTVENYKRVLFRKLGAQTQAHAIAVAVRIGLVNVGGSGR